MPLAVAVGAELLLDRPERLHVAGDQPRQRLVLCGLDRGEVLGIVGDQRLGQREAERDVARLVGAARLVLQLAQLVAVVLGHVDVGEDVAQRQAALDEQVALDDDLVGVRERLHVVEVRLGGRRRPDRVGVLVRDAEYPEQVVVHLGVLRLVDHLARRPDPNVVGRRGVHRLRDVARDRLLLVADAGKQRHHRFQIALVNAAHLALVVRQRVQRVVVSQLLLGLEPVVRHRVELEGRLERRGVTEVQVGHRGGHRHLRSAREIPAADLSALRSADRRSSPPPSGRCLVESTHPSVRGGRRVQASRASRRRPRTASAGDRISRDTPR